MLLIKQHDTWKSLTCKNMHLDWNISEQSMYACLVKGERKNETERKLENKV
jgi:hypothetical protein